MPTSRQSKNGTSLITPVLHRLLVKRSPHFGLQESPIARRNAVRFGHSVLSPQTHYYLPNHGVKSGTQSAARDNRRLALFGHDFLVMIILLQFYAFILRANRELLMAAGSTNPVETLRGWCKD